MEISGSQGSTRIQDSCDKKVITHKSNKAGQKKAVQAKGKIAAAAVGTSPIVYNITNNITVTTNNGIIANVNNDSITQTGGYKQGNSIGYDPNMDSSLLTDEIKDLIEIYIHLNNRSKNQLLMRAFELKDTEEAMKAE